MRRRAFISILCSAFLLAGIATDTFARSRKPTRHRPAPKSTTKPLPAEEPGSILPDAAYYGSALLFNAEDGSILFARNIQGEFPPASLTKLMLALIVVEDLRTGRVTLEQPIRISAAAAATAGSGVYLKKDETFSLDEMMRAALIRSANNACVAIAEALDGSEAAFVERMNAWTRAIGMQKTVFRSAHGLPRPSGAPSDATTAFDMAILARKIVTYPEILGWTSLPTAPFRNGKIQIRSTNRLLTKVQGLDGLKTGFTLSAGFHLIATGERDGVRIVSVVLGSRSSQRRFTASEKLVRLGFASLGRALPGENLPVALPDPETVATLSMRTTRRILEPEPTRIVQAPAEAPRLAAPAPPGP